MSGVAVTRRRVRRALRAGAGVTVLSLALAGRAPAQYMDRQINLFTRADQFEYRSSVPERPLQWELAGWVGNSYTRLWVKSEGDLSTAGEGGDFDVRVEYSRLIAPFWELQGGVRVESRRRGDRTDTRSHLSVGLLGLAPYWFQLEPEFFIGQDGQISARVTAEYDLVITQRLVAQSRVEMLGAFTENREFAVGSGLNYVEPGLRILYEVRREFAPYVGVEWRRQYGGTARLARTNGDVASDVALVVGLRAWR